MISAEGIANILDEQISSYRKLVELLQNERACLVDLDAEGMERLVKEKDTLTFRLRLLDEERTRLIGRFCEENPAAGPPGELNLERLAAVTGDTGFLDMRSKLISLVQNIEELNSFNRMLIERSLGHVQSTRNFFSSFGNPADPGREGKGTLISRET
ncbi:MAG: hypothetical protein Kow0025_04230 [Thermodesulfovibrionales bacterium]